VIVSDRNNSRGLRRKRYVVKKHCRLLIASHDYSAIYPNWVSIISGDGQSGDEGISMEYRKKLSPFIFPPGELEISFTYFYFLGHKVSLPKNQRNLKKHNSKAFDSRES